MTYGKSCSWDAVVGCSCVVDLSHNLGVFLCIVCFNHLKLQS